jgi:hypothetical protein
MTIKWSQIEAECGNYRDGFVATFRKYEGQDTDETDDASRRVKVTVASFARHAGIPERTFRRWVSTTETASTAVTPDERAKKGAAMAREGVRQLPAEERAKLSRELLADPEVAEAAFNTPEVRQHGSTAAKAAGNTARAMARRHERDEAESSRLREQDSVQRNIDAAEAEHALTEAMDRFTRHAREVLRRIGHVSQPQLLGESLERVEAVCDEIRYLRTHGRTRLDAELAELEGR